MPPDQNQVLISAFRKKRPELSAMDDATVLQIVQKNRPELFSQPGYSFNDSIYHAVKRQENSIAPNNPYGVNLPRKKENIDKVRRAGGSVMKGSDTLLEFQDPAQGSRVGEEIIDHLLKISNNDPALFYSRYSGLALDSPQVRSFVQIFQHHPRTTESQYSLQSVKPIPNNNEVKAIEQLGSSIKRRVNLSEPKYYFSSSAEPSPEPVGQDQGFFTGLQDAWGETQKRIEFFKANPEKAQQIKGQATSYQFEPFLSYLDPKASDPLTQRIAKEMVMLTAAFPVMTMTIAESPTHGIAQMGEFMNDMAMDWLKLADPDKRQEGWAEIKRSPLFHATFLSGVRNARKAARGNIKKVKALELIEKDIKEFTAAAEQMAKDNPAFFETLQSMSREQMKNMDFNQAVQKQSQTKLLPGKTSAKIEKINAEMANLSATLRNQHEQLKNPALTETQKQQIGKSISRIEELIIENRTKGQQLGYEVQVDIKPGKTVQSEAGTKITVETPEYFTKRQEGKAYNQTAIDQLYEQTTGEVILLPESKGVHQPLQEFYEQSFKEMSGLNNRTLQSIKKNFTTKVIDVSGNIKQALRESGSLGEQAAILHDLALGANAKSAMIFEDAAKRVFNGLNKHERKLLDTMIETRRNITIREYKPDYKIPGGYEANVAYLSEIKKSDPRLYEKLNQRADLFFGEMKINLKESFDNGLINEKTYNLLKDKDYTRKEFIDYIDPQISYISNGKKVTVSSSGLKRLEEGSIKTVNLDQSGKLFRNISMIQSRIAKNRANLAIRDMIKENPKNGVAIELKPGEKVPAGYDAVSYFEKGQKKEFYMKSEMANEWVLANPMISAELANTISWVSGNKILKSMATGYNPEFALVNFPRDIGYVYLTTSEYSPHLPKFAAQLSADLISVAGDAFSRKGKYRDYVMEGGGMEFLTHQGGFGKTYKPAGKVANAFDAFKEVAKYAGETSEVWVRLALRERALKNGKAPINATWEARNYLDFAQGGSWIKALDSGMPYLNATVQATRGLVRAPGKDPKGFATKTAWITSTASSLWFANNVVNGKAYDDINEKIRNDYWIVTTPFSYTDERGNKRYMYYKFPKDQGQRIIASSTDALLEKAYKNKDASDQVIEGIKDLAGFLPMHDPLPPALDAYIGASYNIDFWRGEPIYDDKGNPVERSQEFTPGRTGQAFIDLGQQVDMSPARLEYMTKQFTTHRNIWTDMVGGGYKMLTQGQDEEVTEEFTKQMLKDIPGARRFISFTNPYKEDKELKRTIIAKNTVDKQQREFGNNLWKQYRDGAMTKKEVIESIRTSDYADKEKMTRRFVRSYQTKDVRNPGWYYDGLDLNPVIRADYFFKKYADSDQKERKIMMGEMKKVPGFVSKRFKQRFNMLTKQYLEQTSP